MNPRISMVKRCGMKSMFPGLVMAVILGLGTVPPTRAHMRYTYEGNDYSTCQGTYCNGGPYALSVEFVTTLSSAELHNLPFSDITSTVTSFAFTDGTGLLVDQNTDGSYASFQVSTDASGRIITWFVGGYANQAEIQMQTNWNTEFSYQPGADFSETTAGFAGDWGFLNANPGTWTAALFGDFNENGVLGAGDLNLLAQAMFFGTPLKPYDLNNDGEADYADRVMWIRELKNTYVGDANLDGEFNSQDFVEVFEAGKYETQQYARWQEGDWDGNLFFDTGDFVKAFEDGGYEKGPKAHPAAVPEPDSCILVWAAITGLLCRVRTRRR